jgi:hypothetical protein
MAQKAKATVESDLTREQLRAAYEKAGGLEKQLMRELSEKGTPREAALVAEVLHYFPDAFLD